MARKRSNRGIATRGMLAEEPEQFRCSPAARRFF